MGSGRPAQAAPEQNPLVVAACTTADWVAPAEMYDTTKQRWFALPMQVTHLHQRAPANSPSGRTLGS